MLSGGSSESLSDTCAATTVTVQVSSLAKTTAGLSSLVLPGPRTTIERPLLLPHEIVNEFALVPTDSLKLIVTFAVVATPVALFAGVVLDTLGAASTVAKLNT